MTAVRPPQRHPRRVRKSVKQRVGEVRPPRSPQDLARAMFLQADQKQTRPAAS